jgi:hypothetical protein
MVISALDHIYTHTHKTHPLDEESARRRELYLTTQHSQELNFHTLAGFEPKTSASERPQSYA